MKVCMTMILLAWVSFGIGLDLDLQTAVALGLNNNPRVKQDQLSIENALTLENNRRADYYPKVSLNSAFSYITDQNEMKMSVSPLLPSQTIEMGRKDSYDAFAQVSVPLYTGDRLSGNCAQAGIDVRLADLSAGLTREALAWQIGTLYHGLVSLHWQREIIVQSIGRAANTQTRILRMYEAGQAIPLDTLDVANRKLELETALIELQRQEANLKARLAELTGINEPFTVKVPTESPLTVSLPQTEAMIDLALANRREPAINRLREERQNTQTAIVRSARLPQVSLAAEGHYGNPGIIMQDPEWHTWFQGGLRFSWNIWDWESTRNLERISERQARTIALDQEQTTARITREIIEDCEDWRNLLAGIALQDRIILQRDAQYRHIQQQYEQSAATVLDLGDSERLLTQAELTRRQLLTKLDLCRLNMDYHTGTLGGKQ